MTSQTNITCQFGRVKGRTFFEANLSVLKAEKKQVLQDFCRILISETYFKHIEELKTSKTISGHIHFKQHIEP